MKSTKLILILVIALMVSGCTNITPAEESNHLSIQGSGKLVSREFDFSGFDRVDAGLSFGLTIRQAEDFSVTLTADDNFIDYILIKQDASTLHLGYQPGYAYNVRGVSMHVDVRMPDLAGLALSGSSATRLVNVHSLETFQAELTGSSALEGDLQSVDASFDLSGSSVVNLSGSAHQFTLESCGNSIANLEKFKVENAAINVSCNSITSINVDGQLDVDASQHAQVYYSGQPYVVNHEIFQNASVKKK